MPPLIRCLMTVAVFASPTYAMSHEFWIEPREFQPQIGEIVEADLRVGETFKGGAQVFLPTRIRRSEFAIEDTVTQITGRAGDSPALSISPEGEGLLVIVHATTDNVLTYREMEKFAAFVEHKDASHALDAQMKDGMPEDGFREVYSRYAKSLVAVGTPVGADQAFGLETELVALENPYGDTTGDGLDVALFYAGEPRSDAQIEVFERAPDTSVSVSTVRTDDIGRATVPVRPGHTYMLDAVVLRRPSAALAADRDAIWESLWANLTFYIP